MQRTKVFAVAAALLTATLAALLLAGGASATAWHTYKGDVFPGHAYALQVPRGAESIELLFEGAPTGSASLGVYAPTGAKVGYYELSADLTGASVANPPAGRYVLYVYEITDGALTIRVASEAAPSQLDLSEVELVRQDTRIGTFEQGKLDQVITTELKAETVFLTLLYQGSSTDLDATVSSAQGAVVTVTDESATAFSPGVWTSLRGERVFDAANLEGTTYTVEVHAAQFEGTMMLTTLGLKLDAPLPERPHARHPSAPAPPAPPSAPAAPSERRGFDSATAHFALQEGVPVAFEAPAGTLLLADPAALDEDEDGDESYGDHCAPLHGIVAIYAPDDTLVGIVELSHDNATASIELPVKGEYVAYARHVEGEVILAKLDGVAAPPAVRTLATEETTVRFDVGGLLGRGETQEIELAHAPVEMSLRFLDGIGTLSSLRLENEKGVVAWANALVVVPGADMLQWASVRPENFASGMHTLAIDGVYEGAAELTSVRYLRDVASTEHAEAHVETHDHRPGPSAPAVPAVPELPELPHAPAVPPLPELPH